MPLSYREMEDILTKELRLYHHPVAITWIFSEEELQEFMRTTQYQKPLKPLSFCQWEVAARMQGKTVLGKREDMDCTGGLFSFGWREADEKQVQSLSSHCVNADQIKRFLQAKPRMDANTLKAVAVGPLGQTTTKPHVIQFCCDTIQAYHLSVDYMAATDTPVLRPMMTGSAASCGGSVFCWKEQTFNLCPGCSGNYNCGKMERGEINVFIPANHLEALVTRLLHRVAATGSGALSRPGDHFPGSDICKNCPQILFKTVKEQAIPGR